jgi:alkaline phosphatase
VILVIGDGMGPQQIGLALAFAQRAQQKDLAAALERFIAKAAVGVHLPFPAENLVNDSACSATMLSSGCSCTPGQLGIDQRGKQAESVVSIAKEAGKRVGLISDTRITHATPAAFAVHVNHRSLESDVADQLIAENSIELLFSGGLSFFVPRSSKDCGGYAKYPCVSGRKDERNLIEESRRKGYETVFNQADLTQLEQLPALGLFAASDMQNAFTEGANEQPTLATMTKKALALLENPKGFFLMVESGQIDWAGHQNDAGWMLRELLRLSSVMQVIEDFSKGREDTLVILTADHETGGFGFTYDSKKNFVSNGALDSLHKQRRTIGEIYKDFSERPELERTPALLKKVVAKETGVLLEYNRIIKILACSNNLENSPDCEMRNLVENKKDLASLMLARAVSERLGAVWASPNHTSTPVFVFSQGPAAEVFSQVRNTEKFGVLLKKMVTHY